MSINDPILEALSFSMENDLALGATATQQFSSSQNHSNTSHLVKESETCVKEPDLQLANDSSFTPSSTLLGEEDKTPCLISECAYICHGNICRTGDVQQEILAHLLKEHQLVIENPNEIANLSKYLNHWRERLQSAPLTEFCVGFAMDEFGKQPEANVAKREGDTSAQGGALYYMFSPALPEDSQLRKQLWKRRLDLVLEVNRQEREETTFCRRCLFCRELVSGNRAEYFAHMRVNHSFHIGQSDNLVFVKELLQFIEDKLNRLECLFCEHIYKDKNVLKEHMRKKQHRKINPQNSEYDRFYIINYLEPGKTWENIGLGDAEDESREEEWIEPFEEKQRNAVCLLCTVTDANFQNVLDHMKTEHQFDFVNITTSLDFYQKVKLVNYIRRTVYQISCLSCDERFQQRSELLDHISEHKILGSMELLPAVEKWNQAEYFFPTYENDDFLTFLDDDGDDNQNAEDPSSSDAESNVIPEDLPSMTTTGRDFDLAGFALRYHNDSKFTK